MPLELELELEPFDDNDDLLKSPSSKDDKKSDEGKDKKKENQKSSNKS